jgi:hypothetical protein
MLSSTPFAASVRVAAFMIASLGTIVGGGLALLVPPTGPELPLAEP